MKPNALNSLLASSVLVLSLAACSSAPKQIDALELARADYSQRSTNENLIKHAPAELEEAEAAMTEADRLWKADRSEKTVKHYAALATQKLDIAEMVAGRKMAESELAAKVAKEQEVKHNLQQQRTEQAHKAAITFDKMVFDMKGRNTHRGVVSTLTNVMFEKNEATLTNAADLKIFHMAQFLKQHPNRRAIIEGHMDAQGDDDFNLDLSRERAYAVRNALIMQGVAGDRIKALGFGESVPLNAGETHEEREQNRRVDVIFPDAPLQLSALK